MVNTTNISLHLITSIEAVDTQGYGEPLTLRLKSNYGDTNITLFFNVGDTGLTKRLVEAINAAIVGPIEPPASLQEEYDALLQRWTAAKLTGVELLRMLEIERQLMGTPCPHEAAAYAAAAYAYKAPLPSYEEAMQDPVKALVLFDASKGGEVHGITENHRHALLDYAYHGGSR